MHFITSLHHTTLFNDGNIEDADVRDMIKQMAMAYDRLLDSVETINTCFAVQVMASTASCFGFNVICIFLLYHVLSMEHITAYNILFDLAINIIWNLYFLTFVLVIIAVGSALSKEVCLMFLSSFD